MRLSLRILLILLTLLSAAVAAAERGWAHESGGGASVFTQTDCVPGGGSGAPAQHDNVRHCCVACFSGGCDDALRPAILCRLIASLAPAAAASRVQNHFGDLPPRGYERRRSRPPRGPPLRD